MDRTGRTYRSVNQTGACWRICRIGTAAHQTLARIEFRQDPQSTILNRVNGEDIAILFFDWILGTPLKRKVFSSQAIFLRPAAHGALPAL